MASPTILSGIASGGNALNPLGQYVSGRQDRMKEDAYNQKLQQEQTAFQQGQQDRQAKLDEMQRQKALEPVREAIAGYYMTPPEHRDSYYKQVAPRFQLDPNANHAQMVGQLISSNPSLLGPDVTNKILEKEFTAPKQEPFNLSPGQRRYDANGKLIVSAPPEPKEPTAKLVQLPDPNNPGQFVWGYAKAGESAPANAKPMTEFQGKSALYADKAAEADTTIKTLEGKYSPLAISAKQDAGILGTAAEGLANKMLGVNEQKAEQAQRNFVNAILRQESGAAISKSEFDNAQKQYFPQPGDSPDVIKQKAMNRQVAISGLRRSAGPSYTPPDFSTKPEASVAKPPLASFDR